MCIVNVTELKLREPKTVYKVLMYNPRKNTYITPFREVIVPKDIIIGARPFIAEKPCRRPYPARGIDEGYVHAYVDLAETVSEYFEYYTKIAKDGITPVIFECRVDPCDEELYCWEGEFDSFPFNDCIAARQMTFVRKFEPEEIYSIWSEKYSPGK